MPVHLVVHPDSGPADGFTQRLTQLGDRLQPQFAASIPSVPGLEGREPKQVAITHNCVAMLLEDGSVARIKYRIVADHVDAPMDGRPAPAAPEPTRRPSRQAAPDSREAYMPSDISATLRDARRRISGREPMEHMGTSRVPGMPHHSPQSHGLPFGAPPGMPPGMPPIPSMLGASMPSRAPYPGSGAPQGLFGSSAAPGGPRTAEMVRAYISSRGRARRPMGGRRPQVSASAVPDELVQRVLEILPDKSRTTVVRQLQRTGLDVDAAVNQLLMSEGDGEGALDDGGDGDGGDAGDGQDGGDWASMQMSMLEDLRMPGSHGMMAQQPYSPMSPTYSPMSPSYSPASPGRPDPAQSGSSGLRSSMPDFAPYLARQQSSSGPARTASSAAAATTTSSTSSTTVTTSPDRVAYEFVGSLERWQPVAAPPAAPPVPIFTHIAALHSGLLAVTREGKLYRWAWTDTACQGGPHQLNDALGLTDERIVSMAACSIRASFLTESGKIATLMDDSFKPSGAQTTNLGRFEHACTRFARFETDVVTSLAVSETLTIVLTSKGRVYWWGLHPTPLRHQSADKAKAQRKIKSDVIFKPGMHVTLRSQPLYHPGAVGCCLNSGVPVLGTLAHAAFALSDKASFSLASGGMVEWRLEDVIMISDGPGEQVGLVLKVDGPHAAVFIPETKEPLPAVPTPAMWESSRLLRVDDLLLVSKDDGAQADVSFVQSTPRHLDLPHKALAVAVYGHAVSAILATESAASLSGGPDGKGLQCPLSFCSYKFSKSGYAETPLLIDPATLARCSLLSVDSSGACVLVDSLGCPTSLYLPAPSLSSVLGLPPVLAASAGLSTHSPSGSSSKPTRVSVAALVLRQQRLAPILRSGDSAAVSEVLQSANVLIGTPGNVFEEIQDGHRNVLHLCAQLPPDQARSTIETLCRHPSIVPVLDDLLAQRNSSGHTPFMSLIMRGAFYAALVLLDTILAVSPALCTASGECQNALFCRDLLTGTTPMHVLVAEELCTYSRTGSNSCAQEIYECHTCNLVNGACLCLPCARSCHASHDVRYKCLSMSAFCDCPDRKLCCIMKPRGNTTERKALVQALVEKTQLATQLHRDGQSTLASLVSMNVRAASISIASGSSSSRVAAEEDAEHAAFRSMLAGDWNAVAATVLMGTHSAAAQGDPQAGAAQLDAFVHQLLQSANKQVFPIVLATIVKAVNAETNPGPASDIAGRFVRSVVRVFTVLMSAFTAADRQRLDRANSQALEEPQSREAGRGGRSQRDPRDGRYGQSGGSRSKSDHGVLKRARVVLRALGPFAVRELAENADALIAPLRMGAVSFTDRCDLSEGSIDDIFSSPNRTSVGLRLAASEHPKAPTADLDEDAAMEDADTASEADEMESQSRVIDMLVDATNASSVRMPPSFGAGYGSYVGGPAGDHSRPSPADSLARVYSRLVRELVDILAQVPGPDAMNDRGGTLLQQAAYVAESQMERTWQWLCVMLDSLDAQMRVAARLMSPVPSHGQKAPKDRDTRDARDPDHARIAEEMSRMQEMATRAQSSNSLGRYLTSLMRAHSSEHGDTQPLLGVTRCRPLAYILDAFMFFVRGRLSKQAKQESERPFFLRTESIVDGPAILHSFSTPLAEALPLAQRPDRLQPTSSRTAMFGSAAKLDASSVAARTPPTYLGLSSRQTNPGNVSNPGSAFASPVRDVRSRVDPAAMVVDTPSSAPNILPLSDMGIDVPSARWPLLLATFVRLFLSDVGAERDSFLSQMAGFKVKETVFRDEMDRARRTHSGEFRLEVSRPRAELLTDTFKALEKFVASRGSRSQPLACNLRVVFRGEPAVGSGVARGLFSALAECLKTDEPLPPGPTSTSAAAPAGGSGEAARTEPAEPGPSDLRSRIIQAVMATGVGDSEQIQAISSIVADRIGFGEVDLPQLLDLAMTARRQLDELEGSDHDGMDSAPRAMSRSRSRSRSPTNSHTSAEEFVDFDPDTPGSSRHAAVVTSTRAPAAESKGEAGPASGPSTASATDLAPLFFVPGHDGFYALRPAAESAYRLAWFRNIGRLIGMALLHGDIFPLSLCRHVYKFLLGRRIAWHDLAFFDPQLYESLRLLLMTVHQGPEAVAAAGLTFELTLRPEMGGARVDLQPNGASIPVTIDNVHQYVELASHYLMVECVKEPLTAMKRGLNDVISSSSFAGLTAEDLRLLLNGCPTVDLSVLKECTNFSDETGRPSGLDTMRRWFWEIVEKFSSAQKQDLVYFWTSSPGLPATAAGFSARPSIVVRPPSDTLLPTANTCICRLSIPLYSSKSILRRKLQLAILTKDYGFV